MKNDSVTVAFLGAGGIKPGVYGVGLGGESSGFLFPTGLRESVYALALSSDGSKMVIGTRTGLLYVVGLPLEQENAPVLVLNQGAAVLSVCFVGTDRFVAADTSGRVLLWSTTSADQTPAVIHEDECPLCVLAAGTGREFVGHRADGGIMAWDLDRSLCPVRTDCPGPPEPLALSRGIWWEAAHAVVFPGAGGILLIYDLERRTVTSVEAHIGGFNAIALLGDILVTFGRTDGIVKGWNPAIRCLAYQRFAPPSIVSAAAIDDHRLVLVNSDGTATIAALTEYGVDVCEKLPGSDYRTVASFEPRLLAELHRHDRAYEISHIQEMLDSCLDGARETDAEGHLIRAEELGAHHMALAYHAQRAGLTGNQLEEFRFRHELADLLPDALTSLDSLRRLAYLLEVLWCLEDAGDVLDRISRIAIGDPACAISTQRVRRQAVLLREGKAILKPEKDLPLRTFVEAADIMGRAFRHTCLIRQLEPLTFSDLEICADDFTMKYESHRENNGSRPLPFAESRELVLLEGRQELDYESSVVIPVHGTPENGFNLAMGFRASLMGTVVTPRVLLDLKAVHPSGSPQEHNAACLHLLERMSAGIISQTEIGYIHETCGRILAKLVNEIKADITRRVDS